MSELQGKQQYVGVKRINAVPMTRKAYNDLRNWSVPADENPADEGYLVEYIDGGPANVPGFEGYVSWSPKEVFEKAYQPVTGMTFGHAVELMRAGCKVARQGWNGKGMFVFLVPGSQFQVNRKPLLGIYPEGTTINYCPHIDMRTADGSIVPWLASQTDVLASDWVLVE